MNKKKIIFIILLMPFLTWLLLELSFKLKTTQPFEFGNKIWIHRLDTIDLFRKAVSLGHQGLEIDIFYVPEEDNFVVTHDWPFQGTKLYLEEYFKLLPGNNIKLWLDLKNGTYKNALQIAKKLKSLEKTYNLANRYFVESPIIVHQVIISWKGVDAVLWLQVHNKSRIKFLRDLGTKLAIVASDFVAVSMPYNIFTDEVKTKYQHLSTILFTVNDLTILEQYKNNPQIKVILKDL